MKNFKFLGILLLIVGSPFCSFADVTLPNIFNDNMVLQQGTPVQVWGWADAGEEVTVLILNQKKRAKANIDGKWSLFLDKLEYGGPFEMVVSGKNTIQFSNVLVGEVWVCSGQSNMEWPLSLSQNAEKEILQSNYPNVRLFKVRKNAQSEPAQDVTGIWNQCEPSYSSGFSAVAYHFGIELYGKLNVPIGLIDASWGGSRIEPWIDLNTLKSKDEFNPISTKWEQCLEEYGSMANLVRSVKEYETSVYEWQIASKNTNMNKNEIPKQPAPLECRDCLFFPGGMYNGMISPIVAFKIRGVIWYQGESNAPHEHYQDLFPALINNWRSKWGLGDFPFLFVQIAPFGKDFYKKDEAARLREIQLETYRKVPNTGMVVTMDIGNVNDIHPRNKKEVGRRLALWALADTYGQKGIVKSGPIYKSMSIEKNKIRINFDFAEGGLTGENGDPTGFEIAGTDNVFVKAKCEIAKGSVLISAESVHNPIAVRYGWGNAAQPTLFNKEGLPASPFRTIN